MADALPPAGWYPDSQVPNTLRWWDGSVWTAHVAPVQPVVAPTAPTPQPLPQPQQVQAQAPVPQQPQAPEVRHRGGLFGGKKELEEEVAQLRQSLAELGVPERDQLRAELADLQGRLPALRQERDSLNGQVVPLRAEVADLQVKQQQLASIQGEIQTLQYQKTSLDGELAVVTR